MFVSVSAHIMLLAPVNSLLFCLWNNDDMVYIQMVNAYVTCISLLTFNKLTLAQVRGDVALLIV